MPNLDTNMPYLSAERRVNLLLRAFAEDDLNALKSKLELIHVRSSQLLRDAYAPATHMYFPITAVVSLLYVMEDGDIAEVAAVGKEGMVGVHALSGVGATPCRVEVRSGGLAYRIAVSAIRTESERAFGIYRVMVLYTQALMTQVAQSALCTRYHSISQQLCRWLLIAHDQLASEEIVVTQQLIANMLGVRRESVTEAAGKLQGAGLIRQRRGRITVLDRHGLEKHSCECYSTICREFGRLLPRTDDMVSSDEEVLAISPLGGKPQHVDRRPALTRSV
jgi:CRP-like cAMP-binding protein